MAATYVIGIRSGVVSGIVTGVILSIILSTIFYATMSNTSASFGTSQMTIAEMAGFGRISNNASMNSALLSIIATTLGGSILAGLVLGIAASAVIYITKRGISFAIASLVLLSLAAYYYQKYDGLVKVIEYSGSENISENLRTLMILANITPPIIFAAIEGMLLNYFWGTFTVVKFKVPTVEKKEMPIQTNSVNETYSGNIPTKPVSKDIANIRPAIANPTAANPANPPPKFSEAEMPKSVPLPPNRNPNPLMQKKLPDDLREAVFECMDKGVPKGEIRALFAGYGYDADAVDQAISEKEANMNL